MTNRRYALRDDQWERIKELLPGRQGSVGVTAKNNRLFVEAVLYRYRAGIPWRDLPERFGHFRKIHTRFRRWAKTGVWERVFQVLAEDADNEYAMIDTTIVRAHPHSAGAKGGIPTPKPSVAAKNVDHSKNLLPPKTIVNTFYGMIFKTQGFNPDSFLLGRGWKCRLTLQHPNPPTPPTLQNAFPQTPPQRLPPLGHLWWGAVLFGTGGAATLGRGGADSDRRNGLGATGDRPADHPRCSHLDGLGVGLDFG